MISIIGIIGKNNAIGKNNKLIWDIPDDLKHFKKITTGHTVIMGRKTFESIGSPLSNRLNIVITRNKNYKANECIICHTLEEALDTAKKEEIKETFIIGGGQIYKQALPHSDKLYLTIVDDEPEADTFFPDYSEFKNIIREEQQEYNNIKYKFVELMKI